MASPQPNTGPAAPLFSEGFIGDKKTDYEGIALPSGIDASMIGTSNGQYYAYQRTYKDGTKVIQWFKRGSGGGEGGVGDKVQTISTQTVPSLASDWATDQAKVPPRASNVYFGPNPTTGAARSKISEYPDPSAPGGVRRIYDDTDVPAPSAAATAPAEPPKEDDKNGRHYIWRPNQPQAGQTGAQAGGQWVDVGPSQQQNTYTVQTIDRNGKRYTQITSAPKDGSAAPTVSVLDENGQPAQIPAAKGQRTLIKSETKPTGQNTTVKVEQWKYEDGTEETTTESVTKEAPRPTIRPGTGGRPDTQLIDDPDHPGQVKAVPIPGMPGSAQLPAGVSRPTFHPREVAKDLSDFQGVLDAKVKAGEMTPADAQEVMTQAYTAAEAFLTEQANTERTATSVYTGQLNQRSQDVSLINQRTSAGAGMANQAISSFLPLLRYAQAGAGDPVAALQLLMGLGQRNVEQMGGSVNPPGIGVPGAIAPYAGGQIPGQAPVPGAANQGSVAPAPVAPQPAAPGVTVHVSGGQPAAATAPSYDPNQWDRGPDGSLVPRAMTPATSPTTTLGPGNPGATSGFDWFTPTGATPGAVPPVRDDWSQPGGLPPAAVRQALYDQIEPRMAADPNWGIDDLEMIRQGVGPLG